ncbi:hypothetical protein [Roseivivax sp. CAU 1761]
MLAAGLAASFLFASGALAQPSAVETAEAAYSPGQPIEVTFEHAPGHRADFATFAPAGAPDTTNVNGQYLGSQTSGRVTMAPLYQEGPYEVRIVSGATGQVVARAAFSIGTAPPAAPAAGSPAVVEQEEEAPAGGPRVRTQKTVYAEGEAVVVEFEGAPARGQDFVAFARLGLPDTARENGEYLGGRSSGSLAFPPWKPGIHEVRLYEGGSGALLARATFAVGATCLDAEKAAEAVCAPALHTLKDAYAPGEPITVRFEGAPGNSADWIGIVELQPGGGVAAPAGGAATFGPYGAPDGQWKPFAALAGKLAGEVDLKGVAAGRYEVWMHVQGAPADQPVARHGFVVDPEAEGLPLAILDPPEQTAADAPGTEAGPALPPPGLAGSWLGFLTCNARKTLRGPVADTVVSLLELAPSDGAVTAEIYVLGTGQEAGAFRASGRDSGGESVALQPTEWIYPARPGQDPLQLDLRLAENGLRLAGSVEGANCTAIDAYKFLRDARPDHARGLLPSLERHGADIVSPELCTAYLSWIADDTASEVLGAHVPSTLHGDDRFYRYIGKPYDRWMQADRPRLQALWDGCVSAYRGAAEIALSSLVERALAERPLWYYLTAAMPPPDRPNPQQRMAFLKNYAAVIALRSARDHAESLHAEGQALDDSIASVQWLAGVMTQVQEGAGIFQALPTALRDAQTERFAALKRAMTGRLSEGAVQAFRMERYPVDIAGLKAARADRSDVEAEVAAYADPEQMAAVKTGLDDLFRPVSAAVKQQALDAVPRVGPDLADLVAASAQRADIETDVARHLLPADARQLLSAYDGRNAAAIERALPRLPDMLDEAVAPDRSGAAKLEELSRSLLGVALDAAAETSFPAPYDGVRTALLTRKEVLTYQICALPPGFEGLREVICLEVAELSDHN